MRSLTGARTRFAPRTSALAISAGLALAASTGARASCTYPPSPSYPLTNIFAYAGSCNVDTSAGAVTVQAQFLPPSVVGNPIYPGLPYTGYALTASYGGTVTTSGGNVLNILSYATTTGTDPYPGAPIAPYGVLSIGTGSSVSFGSPTSVTTGYVGSPGSLTPAPTDNAFGLYARAGGVITASGTMTVVTNGTGASGVVADASAFSIPEYEISIPAGAVAVNLTGGGSVSTIGGGSAGLLAINGDEANGSATITANGFTISTTGADSPGAQADAGGAITLEGATKNHDIRRRIGRTAGQRPRR